MCWFFSLISNRVCQTGKSFSGINDTLIPSARHQLMVGFPLCVTLLDQRQMSFNTYGEIPLTLFIHDHEVTLHPTGVLGPPMRPHSARVTPVHGGQGGGEITFKG